MTGNPPFRKSLRCVACCLMLLRSAHAWAAGPKAEIFVSRLQVGRDASGGAWRTFSKTTYLLNGNHAVDVTATSPSHPTQQSGSAFGDRFETTNIFGLKSQQTIRVVSGTIVVTSDSPSFTIITTIRSDGKSTCTASTEIALKPGFTLFDFGGGHFSTEVHYEDVTCAIRSVEG